LVCNESLNFRNFIVIEDITVIAFLLRDGLLNCLISECTQSISLHHFTLQLLVQCKIVVVVVIIEVVRLSYAVLLVQQL
jgi:hypothetical protein